MSITGSSSGDAWKTPSVTHAWRWAWRLSLEPKRWRKETAPGGGEPGGVSRRTVTNWGQKARSLFQVT